jgi:hypothetical protein
VTVRHPHIAGGKRLGFGYTNTPTGMWKSAIVQGNQLPIGVGPVFLLFHY